MELGKLRDRRPSYVRQNVVERKVVEQERSYVHRNNVVESKRSDVGLAMLARA
jgi:hypothetical protein